LCMRSVGRPRSAPVLGSVSEGVLKKMFGPVALVGPRATSETFDAARPLIVCADSSDTLKSILPIPPQQAITLPLEPLVISVDPSSSREAAAASDSEAAAVHEFAQQLQADIGRPVHHDVLQGKHPAPAIVDFADEKQAALIAMSTHGATG